MYRDMDKEFANEMQRYVEQLAKGINPFTGEIAKEDEIINDVKVSRCLFCVSDILKEIANTTPVRTYTKKTKFVYNPELTDKIRIVDRPISLSQIIRNILEVYGEECKLTYYDVTPILCEKGILVENDEKSPKLVASEQAKQYGIWAQRVSPKNGGERWRTVYDQNGQRYVLSILKDLT